MPATIPVPAEVGTGSITIGKPWWVSKKIWISAIALAIVLYKGATGGANNPEDLAHVLDKIQSVAGVLALVVPLILGIAHVDGKERDIVSAILSAAKSINTPDADVSVTQVVTTPAVAAVKPSYDPTKSSQS